MGILLADQLSNKNDYFFETLLISNICEKCGQSCTSSFNRWEVKFDSNVQMCHAMIESSIFSYITDLLQLGTKIERI